MESVLFQTSLIAAFVAGVVALFAPCCISFLLPAYLGSVFKEKEKVVFMTLLFGLGIFVVMLPAVLGVAMLSKALFEYHDEIYTIGGVVMLFVAGMTFLDIKFPMPVLPGRDANKTDPVSIFLLGVFSGVTSACCAPVLIGILTLTFLSPSFFGALTVGAMYVAGMVFPLVVISVFFSGKVEKFMLLRKKVGSCVFLRKERIIIAGNLIASIIFLATGLTILYLKATGRLSMGNLEGFTKTIMDASTATQKLVGNSLAGNIIFLIIMVGFVWILLENHRRGGEKT